MENDPKGQGKGKPGEGTPEEDDKNKGTQESGKEEKTGEFIEIEGLGKFSPDDVKALKAAQIGLGGKVKDYEKQIQTLNDEIKTIKDKDMSDQEKEEAARETFRKEMKEDRERLINASITLMLKEKGLDLTAEAVNIKAETLADVEAAVDAYLEKYPALKKAAETGRNNNIKLPNDEEQSPGGAPPATDEEKEVLEMFKNAKNDEDLAKAKEAYNRLRNKTAISSGPMI